VGREFFRIVRGMQPTVDDFRPLGATARPLRFPEYRREFEEGVSVFESFGAACDMARRNRFRQGRFVVRIVLPDDGSVEVKQTFSAQHYTIYAPPKEILAYADGDAVRIPDAPGV
jgi:hypothetical protein